MITLKDIDNLEIKNKSARCGLCANNCQLNVYNFNGKRYINGNRCDKPLRKKNENQKFNMYNYKYERLFNYSPLTDEEATRGKIGIPRVLNIYEYYPFWFTFFTNLKFQVLISPRSNKKIYELGMQTIPSESLCYPAKIANGHIQSLIDQEIKTIFYPSVLYESSESKENQKDKKMYSCPVITSYPELIKSNMDSLKENEVDFIKPVVSFLDENVLYKNLKFLQTKYDISKQQLKEAIKKGMEELNLYNKEVLNTAKEQLQKINEKDEIGIVLSGRPYHLDPEINHGIADIITSQNMHVFTEDVIAKLNDKDLKLRVIDQWKYHSRLYKAADYIGKNEKLELVQLNSFGCGIDSITSDQVKEILYHYNKVYTGIKIDEGENLGAAKIRIRSLKATMENKVKLKETKSKYSYEQVPIKGDLKDYTILAPQMSPFHFTFFESISKSEGIDLKILPEVDSGAINCGLKYVHNDSCYPALVVIGQMLEAVEKYNLHNKKIALIISQTGGGCRATNYIALLRRALKEAGYEDVPVIALSGGNVEDINRLKLQPSFIKKSLMAVLYGDALLRVVHKIRPYEIKKGATDKLHKKWIDKINNEIQKASYFNFRKNIKNLIKDFDNIEINQNLKKPKVAIVGEILVKYHPTANNQLAQLIEDNGGEVVIPDLLDFFLYGLYSRKYKSLELLDKKIEGIGQTIALNVLEKYRNILRVNLEKSKNFRAPHKMKYTAQKAKEFLDLANDTGEGWFLTAEMATLLEDGVDNIVCTQPFGCLPNHIMGKGMFKPLKDKYENANIVAIDYDPGASEVNQVSRIKLMMTVAKKNLNK